MYNTAEDRSQHQGEEFEVDERLANIREKAAQEVTVRRSSRFQAHLLRDIAKQVARIADSLDRRAS